MKLLLIEDSERLRRSLSHGLTREGHVVDVAADGVEGLEFAEIYAYDVIVLDLLLPKLDGLSVLRRLRARGDGTHILILSARDRVDDRVRGLDLGADDYLVKPFSFDELNSRLRALGRRRSGTKRPRIVLGELELDTVARAAFVSGAPLHLPAKEYELFEHLVTNRGRAFSRGELIERLYAGTQEINSNVIEALVYALRCKLRGAGLGTLIKTRRHQGYLVE